MATTSPPPQVYYEPTPGNEGRRLKEWEADQEAEDPLASTFFPTAPWESAKDPVKFKVQESGSFWKRGKEDEGLIYKTLVGETWEKILDLLSAHDLLNLMLVSKQFKTIVDTHIGHLVETGNRLEELWSHATDETFPLLPKERTMFWHISQGDAYPTLKHLKALDWLTGVRRVPARQCRGYDDQLCLPEMVLNNVKLYGEEEDEQLGRTVVRLLDVCWMHVHANFGFVEAGWYQFSIRMKLAENLRWPIGRKLGTVYDTIIYVIAAPDEGEPHVRLLEEHIEPEWWDWMRRGKFPQKKNLKNSRIFYDEDDEASGGDSPWFFFCLRPVRLETDVASVKFELHDVENPWWKRGLVYDFFQIRKL